MLDEKSNIWCVFFIAIFSNIQIDNVEKCLKLPKIRQRKNE